MHVREWERRTSIVKKMQPSNNSYVEMSCRNHREVRVLSRDGAINRRGWDINKGPTTI